jgi:hypothetical protein
MFYKSSPEWVHVFQIADWVHVLQVQSSPCFTTCRNSIFLFNNGETRSYRLVAILHKRCKMRALGCVAQHRIKEVKGRSGCIVLRTLLRMLARRLCQVYFEYLCLSICPRWNCCGKAVRPLCLRQGVRSFRTSYVKEYSSYLTMFSNIRR